MELHNYTTANEYPKAYNYNNICRTYFANVAPVGQQTQGIQWMKG